MTGFEIRNFPITIENDEAKKFIEDGLKKQVARLSYERKFKQLNVKVEPGNGIKGKQIQDFINEVNFLVTKKKYFGNPLYCRFLKDLTPEKPKQQEPNSQRNKMIRSPILSLGSVSEKRNHGLVGSPASPEGPDEKKKSFL